MAWFPNYTEREPHNQSSSESLQHVILGVKERMDFVAVFVGAVLLWGITGKIKEARRRSDTKLQFDLWASKRKH